MLSLCKEAQVKPAYPYTMSEIQSTIFIYHLGKQWFKVKIPKFNKDLMKWVFLNTVLRPKDIPSILKYMSKILQCISSFM